MLSLFSLQHSIDEVAIAREADGVSSIANGYPKRLISRGVDAGSLQPYPDISTDHLTVRLGSIGPQRGDGVGSR